jgi:hypothetical protein
LKTSRHNRTKGEESRSRTYHQTSNSSLRRMRAVQVIRGTRRQGRWLRARRAGTAVEGEEIRSSRIRSPNAMAGNRR